MARCQNVRPFCFFHGLEVGAARRLGMNRSGAVPDEKLGIVKPWKIEAEAPVPL
jgi:hypothetical protein